MAPFILETSRLIIRPFAPEDLRAIHRILDLGLGDGSKIADEEALSERRSWLEWSRLSAEWLPRMFQPPYGDRAVVLKSSNDVIGAVGLVPCLDVFEQIPGLGHSAPESIMPGIEASAGSSREPSDRLRPAADTGGPRLPTGDKHAAYRVAEIGLFWAIDPDQQRQGYATEAAQALIDLAFQQLRVKRLIATTEYDNVASLGVMRKLGMRIERNPFPEPPWLQVVGILEHPSPKEFERG